MLSSHLQALVLHRKARAKLFNDIVTHSRSSAELVQEEIQFLRSEEVAQIIELFFVIDEMGLRQPDELRKFVIRHNEKIERLISMCESGYTPHRLSISRLKKARFSPRQVDRIIFVQQGRENTVFDQTSITKLVAELMSKEHCRKMLVLLGKCGFFARHDLEDAVYLSSRGVMESIFRNYLQTMIDGVQTTEKKPEKVA